MTPTILVDDVPVEIEDIDFEECPMLGELLHILLPSESFLIHIPLENQ